jgi:yersiniabactin salicyl-AMP ligase
VEDEISTYFTKQNILPFPCFIGSLPDEILGEKVVLFIEKQNKDSVNFDNLKSYLSKTLKNYEIPKQVQIVDEFYYTPSQKIDRNKSK